MRAVRLTGIGYVIFLAHLASPNDTSCLIYSTVGTGRRRRQAGRVVLRRLRGSGKVTLLSSAKETRQFARFVGRTDLCSPWANGRCLRMQNKFVPVSFVPGSMARMEQVACVSTGGRSAVEVDRLQGGLQSVRQCLLLPLSVMDWTSSTFDTLANAFGTFTGLRQSAECVAKRTKPNIF